MPSYLLSLEAKQGFEGILDYTLEKYGVDQMLKYTQALELAAEKLALGHATFKEMKSVHPNLRVVKSGKHYVFGLMRDSLPMIVMLFFMKEWNY